MNIGVIATSYLDFKNWKKERILAHTRGPNFFPLVEFGDEKGLILHILMETENAFHNSSYEAIKQAALSRVT